MKTTIIITLLDDERVFRTLESLEKQTVRPDEIIIADGGSSKDFQKKLSEYAHSHDNVVFSVYPGHIAKTRNSVINDIDTDIIVFIDADEVAPSQWLSLLVKPIKQGKADFTGGKTIPLNPPKNKCEEFINGFDKWFYCTVTQNDATAIPMGNSAWRKKIFDTIGNFDETLRDAEDFDISLRAVNHGFKGMFVEDAWLYHDQSGIDTLWKIWRRKYKYSVGTTIVYLKNSKLELKSKAAVRVSLGYKHPIEFVNLFVKGIAFIKGYIEWKKKVRL